MNHSFYAPLVLVISLSMHQSVLSQQQFKIIGHRGAMGYELENTRASFEKAIELKADMIELDVFKCATGEIVVFHDETLERLSNSAANIEDLTLDEIQKIQLKNGETIPLLEEILQLINGRVPLNIELKGKETSAGTLELINKSVRTGNWNLDDFIISSFDWDELQAMRKLSKTIAIAVLTENNPIDAIAVAQKLQASAINPWYKKLSASDVSTIHSLGFKIYAYTVNKSSSIRKMKKLNIDGIFTNYPDIARNL